MILSRSSLPHIAAKRVAVPDESVFHLPEKVLQFGTGVLLRGLPDYFIDKANRQGLFNGRVVVVKSTAQGDASAFHRQDGLYTLCVRGVQNGLPVAENSINASISRVLDAQQQWQQVLQCARNQHLQVIISNTTEAGIQFVDEDIRQQTPQSFPGKLLAVLYERYKAFGGRAGSGLVVVPTELVPDNGKKLQGIVQELAGRNNLEEGFRTWLQSDNRFCSSLVDRIVPGRPDKAELAALEHELGYTDDLLIVSEVYRLWAIEGDEEVKKILSFSAADEGVVIEPDINRYRELKLRLLNGTHTLTCGLAFLAGCETVKEAMDDAGLSSFITGLMHNEIAPSIPCKIEPAAAHEFGNQVLDRFRNPHLRHLWINITLQYSSKLKMRCIPVLLKHYEQTGKVPQLMALGFAAYLCFMRPVQKSGNQYFGEWNGQLYPIQDDEAATFYTRWQQFSSVDLVHTVLADSGYWGADLSALPGFEQRVSELMQLMITAGARQALIATLNTIKDSVHELPNHQGTPR